MDFIRNTSRLSRLGLFLILMIPASVFAGNGLSGVGNFVKVDDHVFRGAQPTEQGFQNLAKLGIRTVVDLQESGDARSKDEARMVKAAGMQYVSVPMKGMETPSNESVKKVLSLLEDTTTGPVFVHCHRGADRTGGVIACYRMEHDHWTSSRALAEATSMGMSWYQMAIQRYVKSYQPRNTTPAVLEAAAPSPAAAAPAPAGAIPAVVIPAVVESVR